MPTVPRLNQEVQQQGLPNVRVDPNLPIESFGGGQSLANVNTAAQALVKTGIDIKEQADLSRARDFDTRAVAEMNKLLWDPQNGAMNKKGQAAFNVTQEYDEQFNKYLDTLESELSNDQQKSMAQSLRNKYSSQMRTSLDKHTSGEIQRYEAEQTQAAILSHRDDAILNYQEPGRVENSINMQTANILKNAETNGESPEVVAVKVAEARSRTQYSVISRMLANGDDMGASAYYKATKGEFTGFDSANIEKALEEGSLRGNSQRESDAIMRKGMDYASSLEAARKIEDPKLRDETVRRVRDRFSENKAAEADASDKLFDNAYKMADNAKSMDVIPPEVLSKLKPDQIKHIRNGISGNIEPNSQDFYDLKLMASNPATRESFKKINLTTYRGRVTPQELNEMIDIQAGIQKGNSDSEAKLDGFLTEAQMVDGGLRAAGYNVASKNASDQKAINAFRSAVDRDIMYWKKQNGKTWIPNDEAQRIIDNKLVEIVVDKGVIWDTKKKAFEVEKTEIQDIDYEDIPKMEVMKIKELFNSKGIQFSEDKAKELYLLKLRKSD